MEQGQSGSRADGGRLKRQIPGDASDMFDGLCQSWPYKAQAIVTARFAEEVCYVNGSTCLTIILPFAALYEARLRNGTHASAACLSMQSSCSL